MACDESLYRQYLNGDDEGLNALMKKYADRRAGRTAAGGGGHPDGGAQPRPALLHERNKPGLSGSPLSHLF